MLITQSFKYPLRRVSLLLWSQLIYLKDLIDDSDKAAQLRASDLFVTPITWGNRKGQHLLNSATVDPKNTRSFASAHAVNKNSVTNPPI